MSSKVLDQIKVNVSGEIRHRWLLYPVLLGEKYLPKRFKKWAYAMCIKSKIII